MGNEIRAWQIISVLLFLAIVRIVHVNNGEKTQRTATPHAPSRDLIPYGRTSNSPPQTDEPSPENTVKISEARHLYQAERQADAAWATFRLVFAALIVSVVAAVFAGCAFYETRRQADAAVADLRPWLKITMQVDDLSWWLFPKPQNWIGNMSPHLNVKNIGRSPAFSAKGAVLFYYPGKQTIRESQLKICKEVSDDEPQESSGETVFPGDDFDPDTAGIGRLGFGIESNDLHAINGRFNFIIIGCVDYLFGSPLVHHQTFLAYGAMHLITNGAPPRRANSDFLVGESVKADHIRLYKLNGLNDAN